jgi:DNA-binding transcriptional regulator YhcF (GntR family)
MQELMQHILVPNPTNNWLYHNEPFNKITAWVDLVMNAVPEDTEFKINKVQVILKKGQLITSVRACAYRWNWSKTKVCNFFKQLEKDKMITRDKSTGTTVIIIHNYDEILLNNQLKDDLKIQDDKNTQEEIQVTVTKVKKNKYFESDELDQAFIDFVEMRKRIKKPMTDRAIKMALNKLKKLATNEITNEFDIDVATAILEQSIFKSWTDLYPLRGENNNNSRGVDWRTI